MKKSISRICVLILMLMSAVNLSAQEWQAEYNSQSAEQGGRTIYTSDSVSITTIIDSLDYVKASGFWDNWHVGVGFGPSILLAESDRRGPLSGRFAPAIDVTLGKWVIPSIGFRIQYSGWKAKGYIAEDYVDNTAYGDLVNGHWYRQKFNYSQFRGDAMVNLMNAIGEYREDRFYTLTTYIGLGIMSSKETDALEYSGTLGVLNNFRLSPSFDITLDVRGTMVHDRFDGETESNPNKIMEGLATATVGVAYKFKPRGWKSTKINILNVGNNQITKYHDMLAQAEQDKLSLKKQVDSLLNREPIIINEVEYKIITAPIFFDINKWNISNREMVKLSYIAEFINNSPADKTYKVIGCADMQTGNDSINARLSQKRAESVYQTLIDEFGVDADKIEMESRGGVDFMFMKDNELSRVVILEY